MSRFGFILTAVLFGLCSAFPAAAMEITPTGDGTTLSSALVAGGGIIIKSVTHTGQPEASGTYTAGPLGIADGVLLTTGAAINALPPNDSESMSTQWDGPGDSYCELLLPGGAFADAVRLEVVFELQAGFDGVGFDYLVGSDEYPQWVGTEFNDVVGIFIDGANLALDAEGNPITISGPFFTGDSVVQDTGTEYNGSTPRLQRQVPLTQGVEHTLILVVCDVGDDSNDTALFMAAMGGCKGDCATTTWCGDGAVDEGEDCDDGNNIDGDGCDNTCQLEPVCGDGLCYVTESCEDCPADCGECPSVCGDFVCDVDENCEVCPYDCGECSSVCGDFVCSFDENCDLCPYDCGECQETCLDCGQCGPDCGGDCPEGYECSLDFMCESTTQLVVTGTSLGSEMANALVVPNAGLEIEAATFMGYDCSSGTFANGPLGSGSGAILTTGYVKDALPPNDAGDTTGSHGGVSEEAYCSQLAGTEVYDAARLTVDFVLLPGQTGIQFGFLFGSEEYPEYVGQVNDVAGVFLDGVNVAMDAEGNPITINGPFFSGTQVVTENGTEYNGATPYISFCAPLEPGPHTLVIVVCDAVDSSYDSAILVSGMAGFTGTCGQDPLWCGDMVCNGEETCGSCEQDCGPCTAQCGDGECNGAETCETCEQDCGACPAQCGDGECNGEETCETCGQDCGACPAECGDGECNGEETCETCEQDCGACAAECGDGECNGEETCETCEQDCGACAAECGDGECNGEETCGTCEQDCGACAAECGDGECNGEETCGTCEQDCGPCATCGDGNCTDGENCTDCPDDCGACGEADRDGDGVLDDVDNCPDNPNADQLDWDEDGVGNVCDPEGLSVSGGACSASPTQGAGSLPWPIFLLLAGFVALGVRRRPFRKNLLVALIALTAATASAPASAEQIETQAFRPSPFMQDYFTVGTGETQRDCCRWNVGLFLNYQNDPLVLRSDDDDVVRRIVAHQATANLLASFRFLDWLALGLDVPVVLFQDGDGLGGFSDPGAVGLGDIRITPRARLLRLQDGLFSLAAELVISLPTGQLSDPYMGRAGFGFMPRLLASTDLGWGGMALNLGVLAVTGDDTFANVSLGHTLDARLGAWLGLVQDKLDLVGEVGMQMKLMEPFANMEENPLEALGGIKWHAVPGLDVSLGGGAGVTQGAAAPDFRLFAGLMYSPCGEDAPAPVCEPDQDADGVCSDCVSEQGRQEEFAATCSGLDKCPEQPEDKDGFEDVDGCPDADNDQDGICDPWVAEKGKADAYAKSCQGKDNCPDKPEDKDGFEDDDGCPDADNDKDRFCDSWVAEKGLLAEWEKVCKGTDACPGEPETVNSYDDDDGCPDKAVVVEQKKIAILQTVLFYFDETRIKEESFPLLDEVVKVLKENPQLLKIRIEGHTDERGEAPYNQKLSAGRVETVLEYLVKNGVERSRLTSQGFGESKPLVKNAATEEDHQKNRRVEFIILEQSK